MSADCTDINLALLASSLSSWRYETPADFSPQYVRNCEAFKQLNKRGCKRKSFITEIYDIPEAKSAESFFYGPIFWAVFEHCEGHHLVLPIWYGPQFWPREPESDAEVSSIFQKARENGGYDKVRYQEKLTQFAAYKEGAVAR